MQFCEECGGVLNLFENNDEKTCWSCVRKKDRQKPPSSPPAGPQITDSDELSEARFSCENNMLVLKAQEGWILWSGPMTQEVTLDTIMKQARRIHQIRKRRQQNKN